jgi:hypothetical protein
VARFARFQAVVIPLLNRAAELGDRGHALVDEFLPENVMFGSMPEGAVYRLHLVGTANYRAGVLCLRHPETSIGAFALLRGLLEVWSHLTFIGDDTARGDARCRALRYEFGAMREWVSSVYVAPPAFDKDAWKTQHDEKRAELEALWRTFGCEGRPGKPRTRSHVVATLKTLAEEPGMDWITAIWGATSATDHMYGVDFALEDRGDGTSELVWALPRYRAAWLTWLAAAYGYLTKTAASILRPANLTINRFHEDMRELVTDPVLQRSMEGEYDSES